MQVTQLVDEGLKKEYKIVVSANDIAVKIENNITSLSKEVKIQGFRPGKVPPAIIKQRYNQTIMQNVLDDLLQDTSKNFFAEHKLRPAMKPNVVIVNFKEAEDFEYKLSFEIFPDIVMPNFGNIKITKFVCDINEAEIDNGLERIAKGNKQFVHSDKDKAELGDAVVIDFDGKINGVAIDNGSGKDHRLELGSGQFIPGFEEQIVGAQVGDNLVVSVSFPDDYNAKHLAGQNAEFDVTVKEILTGSVPVINDEWAVSLGAKDLAELRDNVRQAISNDADRVTQDRLRKDLFDALEKVCDFPVPQGMVDAEFNVLWERVTELQKGSDAAEGQEALRATYQRMSKRRVLLGMLLAEYAKLNQIQAEQEELRQAVYSQARSYAGQEHMVLDYFRKNPEAVENLKGPIIEDKAVKLILEQIQLTETKVAFKDFPDQVVIKEEDI